METLFELKQKKGYNFSHAVKTATDIIIKKEFETEKKRLESYKILVKSYFKANQELTKELLLNGMKNG